VDMDQSDVIIDAPPLEAGEHDTCATSIEGLPPAHTQTSPRCRDAVKGKQTAMPGPLEIEGASEPEPEYPTGIKFAVVVMALGLSLVITGLVGDFSGAGMPTLSDRRPGQQYSCHSCPSYYKPLQDDCRRGMVLFGLVNIPCKYLFQSRF